MPCWKINRIASFSEMLSHLAFLANSLTFSRNSNGSSFVCFSPNNSNLLSHIENLFLDNVLVALPLMKYCLRSCLHNDSFCEEYLLVAVQPNAFRSVAVAQW